MKMAAGFHLAVGCLWALFMVWFLLVIGGVPDSLIGWALRLHLTGAECWLAQ